MNKQKIFPYPDVASKFYNMGRNFASVPSSILFKNSLCIFVPGTVSQNDLKRAKEAIFTAVGYYDEAIKACPAEKFSKKIERKREGLKASYLTFINRQLDSVNKLM